MADSAATADDRLAQIQRIADAATTGPWIVSGYGNVISDIRAESDLRRIGKFIPAADAEFVAAAREDVPWLLAEVVSLRGQITAATELAEHLTTTCRYHGHHIERTLFGRVEPCCDTGREAVRNVRLIAALGGAR